MQKCWPYTGQIGPYLEKHFFQSWKVRKYPKVTNIMIAIFTQTMKSSSFVNYNRNLFTAMAIDCKVK